MAMDEPLHPQTPASIDQAPRELAPAASEERADSPELAPEDCPTDTETTTRPAQRTRSPWQGRLTRREIVAGLGVTAGVVGLGVGLAVLAGSPTTPQTIGGPASQETNRSPTARSSPRPTVNPVRLAQTLEDWRTRRLTIQPAQRFQPQTGSAVVPLGVIEPAYPNPYNPSTVHLHAYLLGGEVIGKLQLFWYLGLEARDGTQFVAKLRVGPLDKAATQFSVLVMQQAQDTIAGGGTPEYPPAQLTPNALSQALPVVTGHGVVVVLIRQTLPTEAQSEGIPPALFQEINQQVSIADRFLAVDYTLLHTTSLAQVPQSDLTAIRNVIDAQPISYRTPTDGGKYPLLTQVVLRHSDQVFPKLGG